MVLGGQGLQQRGQGVPPQAGELRYVLGKQVVIDDAAVLGSVDPDDLVVVQVLEPGPVPRFAVFPVAGVRDQGLVLVEFQSEGLPEELRQPGLDLLGFGLRPDKAQYVIICLCRCRHKSAYLIYLRRR